MIEQLPQLTPNPLRFERTRARCHKTLARRNRPRPTRRFQIERAVLLALGTVYLSSLTVHLLQVLVR